MRHLNGQTAARYDLRYYPRAMIVERSNAHEAPLKDVGLSKDKVLVALDRTAATVTALRGSD
jgi:hypothetical protein